MVKKKNIRTGRGNSHICILSGQKAVFIWHHKAMLLLNQVLNHLQKPAIYLMFIKPEPDSLREKGM